jgi:hypothetical protein
MAIAILDVPTFSNIPSFVPFGVLYYTQDTADLYIGTGSSSGPAVNFIAGGGGDVRINTQTSSYVLVAADASAYVRMNVASANTVTVSADSTTNFATGTIISIRQVGAGTTTITAGGGVTISSPSTLALRAQNSTVQIVKVAANTWDLMGDVA